MQVASCSLRRCYLGPTKEYCLKEPAIWYPIDRIAESVHHGATLEELVELEELEEQVAEHSNRWLNPNRQGRTIRRWLKLQ